MLSRLVGSHFAGYNFAARLYGSTSPTATNDKVAKLIQDMECRVLTTEDLPLINDFHEKFYTMQNPIRDIFKLTRKDIGDHDKIRAETKVKDNASFGLFHKTTQQLVAMVMHSIHDKNSIKVTPTDGEVGSGSPKFEPLRRFFQHVEGDLFKDLNTDKFIMQGLAATDPQYRAFRLWDIFDIWGLQAHVARKAGCEYMAAVAVSQYSRRYYERNGTFSVLREVNYADYVDTLTGLKPDLALSPIHTTATLFFKEIPHTQ